MDQKLAYMEQLTVYNLAKKICSFIEPKGLLPFKVSRGWSIL